LAQGQAMDESEELFEQLLQHQPDPIAVQDFASGEYLLVSAGFESCTGYSAAEVIGKTDKEIFFWAIEAEYKHIYRSLDAIGEIRAQEFRMRRKNGDLISCLAYCRVFETGSRRCVMSILRDISALKQQQQDLTDCERALTIADSKFNAVFHSAFDYVGISRVDNGTYLDVNEGYQEATGFTRAETIGKKSTDVGIWPFPEDRLAWIARLRAEGTVLDYPMTLGTKSGHREALLSAATVDIAGTLCVIATIQDVTDQRRAERALRRLAKGGQGMGGEAYFPGLIGDLAETLSCDFAFIALKIADKPGSLRTIAFHAKGQRIPDVEYSMSGTPTELVVSSGEMRIFPEDACNIFRDQWLIDHNIAGYAGMPLRGISGEIMGILAVMRSQPIIKVDLVTSMLQVFGERAAAELERKRTEEALRASEKKFSAIFHSSPVALSVSSVGDGKYTILDINEAWERQFGMMREAIIGRDNRESQFWIEQEDCDTVLAAVEQGGEIQRYEAWRRRGDGDFMLCEISARLFEVANERLLLMAEEDITEKRKIEMEIRELNISLESRVEERTAELKAANGELSTALDNLKLAQNELLRSEKLAALGSLVAGVAHELNTPIGNSVMVASTLNQQTTGINQSLTSGLKRSMLETYLNDASNATDIILRNLNRAAELIASFKQVAVDQTSSQRRQFTLEEVVSEIVVTLRPTLRKTPYTIEYEIPQGIRMDSFPGPLGQVITNLINNAILHGFDGGPQGKITIEARQLNERQTELKLRDDGKGIEAANLGRIFDPFFTTKLGKGGSGLGLNIVYSIVTGVLGGDITVDSEVGKGSTFNLILPKVAPTITVVPSDA